MTLDPLTATVEVRLRRPTTASLLAWPETGRVSVALVLVADGIEYRCTGSASGGIHRRIDGSELAEYALRYTPPWGFFGARSGRTRRLGEGRATYQARVDVTLLAGEVATDLDVTSEILPAPDVAFHSSVAFDAATSANEVVGDGILSLTHTATGSNLAAFAANANVDTPLSTSITYDGASMTELWDIQALTMGNAGYARVVAAGTITVTSTLASAASDHLLGVVSMTGVDQTTPVGTAVSGSGNTATPSVTVGSVGADDMVVDNLLSYEVPTVGADQTLRNTRTGGGNNVFFRQSTQLGSAGGVMSWSQTAEKWILGAVAFKPAAGGAAVTYPQLERFGSRGIERGIMTGVR